MYANRQENLSLVSLLTVGVVIYAGHCVKDFLFAPRFKPGELLIAACLGFFIAMRSRQPNHVGPVNADSNLDLIKNRVENLQPGKIPEQVVGNLPFYKPSYKISLALIAVISCCLAIYCISREETQEKRIRRLRKRLESL